MSKLKIWLKRILFGLSGFAVISLVTLLIYQKVSDGPTGPLMGGTFSSGEIVQTPIEDWSALEGDFEFELVGQGSARTAGGILVDGNLYITCDLGFVWSRVPNGLQRNMLHLIWVFKTWHEEALLDGRIRIRKDGRIHSGTIALVDDPQLIEVLKNSLEALAGEFFEPEGLGPRRTQEPNDVWFFRVSQ